MRKLLNIFGALALFGLFSGPAAASCSGVFLPGAVCANFGSGSAIPGPFVLGTNVPAWLITPSSANLAAAVTDETGTGPLVFANSPVLTAPNIGSATALELAINPAAATTNPGVVVTQSGPTVGTQATNLNYNTIDIAGDNYGITAASVASALNVLDSFGGSNTTGARDGIQVNMFPSGSESTDVAPFYTGVVSTIAAANTVAGSAIGAVEAYNGYVQALASAVNYSSVVGSEMDVGVATGATGVNLRAGYSAVSMLNLHGTTYDAAFAAVAKSSASWLNAMYLSDYAGGQPLDATNGCVLCNDGASHTIKTGFDIASYTITGNFLKGPNGFQVTGNGILTASGESIKPAAAGANLQLIAPTSGYQGSLTFVQNATTMWQVGMQTGADPYFFWYNSAAVANSFTIDSTTNQVAFPVATVSSSPTTGGVIFGGGVGVAGAGYFGGVVETGGYAIASLPSCAAGTKGARAYVTNGQTTPTFLGTVSTTGAVVAPVFCNGTAWIYALLDDPANDNFAELRKAA